MALFLRTIGIGICAVALAACAPQETAPRALTAEDFPLALNTLYTVEIAGSKPFARDFILRGKPTITNEAVIYSGLSEGDEVVAYFYRDGTLFVETYLETTRKVGDNDLTYTAMCAAVDDEDRRYIGKGNLDQYQALSEAKNIEDWPECQVYPATP